MAESNAAITNAVLLTLLPGLQRLSQFLDTNLNAQSTVVCSDDPAEYKCLLHDTLVAPTPAAAMKDAGIAIQSFPTESRQSPGGRQDDIVDYAIRYTCSPNEWPIGKYNILAAGYKSTALWPESPTVPQEHP
ncbi:hypothetical protein F5H01DRAFT_131766 [Linnemannia elongata]|nr:hypothetical protein F5H01DRAFT_131766 [Linnemannia elongata]